MKAIEAKRLVTFHLEKILKEFEEIQARHEELIKEAKLKAEENLEDFYKEVEVKILSAAKEGLSEVTYERAPIKIEFKREFLYQIGKLLKIKLVEDGYSCNYEVSGDSLLIMNVEWK